MSRWKLYNPNPVRGSNVGDCTVRAISKALDQDWETTYAGLSFVGFFLSDMPSANRVWNEYLKRKGFKRYVISNECPLDYTVNDFARDNPIGTYVLALDGHVVTVSDGYYWDSWDSGNEIPLYYWSREV